MLVILIVAILPFHRQSFALKSFSTFLEHAHLVTDATELGIHDKITNEGLYKQQKERDKGELSIAKCTTRNTSKVSYLPLAMYKGTDNADHASYFIAIKELSKGLPSFNNGNVEEEFEESLADRSPHQISKYSNIGINVDYQDHSPNFLREAQVSKERNNTILGHQATDIIRSISKNNHNSKLISDNMSQYYQMDKNIHALNQRQLQIERDYPNIKNLRQNALNSKNGIEIEDPSSNKRSKTAETFAIKEKYHQVSTQQKENELESKFSAPHSLKFIPKLKFLFNECPQSVLGMNIDLNSLKNNNKMDLVKRRSNLPLITPAIEFESPNKLNLEDYSNSNQVKMYLKNKIVRKNKILNKEEQIHHKLKSPAKTKANMELSFNKFHERNVRSVDAIDRSITYTEHERTMKQEVEVTYKRAQDIAKAILKTSEAVANTLDLCRKPISTNFISDEPLTEAENIIGQIVGQLKESLELSMGCRTCVKPHKDLMLFLRWLIFDDVSIKLCPSKPKAADLRKNYLLFNHDNQFIGHVCSPGENSKAPYNCSANGEINKPGYDEKRDGNKICGSLGKGITSKKRRQETNRVKMDKRGILK